MTTGVAVLHFGDPADTRACLRSVAASRVAAAPLVVVDNGTRAITAADVVAAAPGAVFVALPEHLGFAGGCNVGIRCVMAAGADGVVLLNNDAQIEPDCVGELRRLAAGPTVAAVGGQGPVGRRPVAPLGRVGAPELARRAGRDGRARRARRPALRHPARRGERAGDGDAPHAWGARRCQALRRAVLRLPRGPRLVHPRAGTRVAHLLRSRGAPDAPGGGQLRYLSARNSVLFARKHGRLRDRLQLALTVGLSLPRECRRLRRRGEAAAALLVHAYVDGLPGRDVPYGRLGLR